MHKANAAMKQNEIAALAASLRPIDQKLLKPSSENGTTRIWYQGEEPYFDIFFDLKDDEIIWFQLTLRGKSLSWDSKRPGWQTGTTNEMKVDDVNYYPASKTIETDSKPDLNFVNVAQSILLNRAQEPIFTKVLALFDED